MAPRSSFLLGPLLLLLLTRNVEGSSAALSSEEQQVLQLVNDYRTQVVGIPALSTNNAASCVGKQVVHRFVDTPCTNTTGAGTPDGETPQFSDFPNMLATCHVDLVNATMGYIALNCVPVAASSSDAPSVAAQNFTDVQQYQLKLNDTTFTSAGVGSEGVWYALVLATDSPDGSYGVTDGLNGSGANSQHRLQMPAIISVLLVILAAIALWNSDLLYVG